MKIIFSILCIGFVTALSAQGNQYNIDYESVEDKVITWRRDIHQNPELSNREFKTAAKLKIDSAIVFLNSNGEFNPLMMASSRP